MRGVATSVASASSSARTRCASRSSCGETERTRTPRFGSNVTSPRAASRRSASRTGVRLTTNRSESCSCRSTVPGAIDPPTISSSSTRAMSSALVERVVIALAVYGRADASELSVWDPKRLPSSSLCSIYPHLGSKYTNLDPTGGRMTPTDTIAPVQPEDVDACAARSPSSTRSPGSAQSASAGCWPRTWVPALGAMTGGQAVQMVRRG